MTDFKAALAEFSARQAEREAQTQAELQHLKQAVIPCLRQAGIAKVEIVGERATVQTVKGTRYAFRRRDNGIWGLTLFTAALHAEAEKAARDAALIEKNAGDYERVRGRERGAIDGG